KHEQGIPLDRNSHNIETKDQTLISRLITSNKVQVNSHHHQSIEKIGKNLKFTAWAKDGVIECLEDTRENRFILGVQWHPELNWRTDELSKNIFQNFIEAAREYTAKRS